MISDEQARLAAKCLRDNHRCRDGARHAKSVKVDPELLERVRREIEGVPELREERLQQARDIMDGDGPSSNEVAGKVIGRVISDALT